MNVTAQRGIGRFLHETLLKPAYALLAVTYAQDGMA